MSAIERLQSRLPAVVDNRRDRLLKFIAGLLVVLVLWACLFSLEEQIRAPGTVIASSHSQVVQIVDGGTLKELRVKAGDAVKAGDLLALLDRTRYQASNDEIAVKAASLKANLARLQAELDGRALAFTAEINAYPDLVKTQQALAGKRRQAQQSELAAIDQSRRLAEEELNALVRLVKTGDASQTEVLRARRQVIELRALRTNKHNAFRQEAQAEIATTRAELDQTLQVLTQRGEAVAATYVKAPMSGVVKNIKFTTLGAVLRSGDELMQIVPSNDPLIIEAKVAPKDVGFLHTGLPANVKLDAFDYTRYGTFKGKVIYISPDTLTENLQQNEQPYYRVHVQTELPQGPLSKLDIRPGMTTSVEIITGEKTVASYVIKPLRRGIDEALHEP
ncbi:MAG: HlyD family type I secretion periplasmic adaptor subunit [Pseudomonadota bacterium]